MEKIKEDRLNGTTVAESNEAGMFYFIFPGPDGTYHSAKFDHRPSKEECLNKLPQRAAEILADTLPDEPEVKKSKKKNAKQEENG